MNLLWKDGERRIPNNYPGFSALVNSCVAKRLDLILPFVKRNQIILDLGCGVGWNTKYISLYCKKIYGLDISEKAINYACRFNDAKNIEWIMNSMHDLSMFSDSSIDLIVAIASIEHINRDKMQKMINEIYRILKPKFFFVGTSAPFGKKSRLNVTRWHKYIPNRTAFKEITSGKFDVKQFMNFVINTPDLEKKTKEGYFVLRSRKK